MFICSYTCLRQECRCCHCNNIYNVKMVFYLEREKEEKPEQTKSRAKSTVAKRKLQMVRKSFPITKKSHRAID